MDRAKVSTPTVGPDEGKFLLVSIAGAWYTSGTLWTATGAIVALLVGLAIAVVTYIVAFPKRRLLYEMTVATPLLTAPAGIRDDIELRHRGVPLTEPQLLEIQLISRGRKDIPSHSYDNGDPIILDVGVRIVEVLKTCSQPVSARPPRVSRNETSLSIGPSLISKRQEIVFTLLVDGSNPHLKCQSSLVDVEVRQLQTEDLRPVIATLPMVGLAVGVVAGALGATWLVTAAFLAQHEYVTAGLAESTANAAEQLAVLSRTTARSGPEAARLSQEIAKDAAGVQFASNVKGAELSLWLIDSALGTASIMAALIALFYLIVFLRRRWMRR